MYAGSLAPEQSVGDVALIKQRQFTAVLLCAFTLATRLALCDAYDPPANYYNAATGTGATLKSQFNDIIDGHTTRTYDQLRSDLQVTDADPNNPGHILLVYDRVSLDLSAFTPTNPPNTFPGWNPGFWNREHTWPQSRGVETTSDTGRHRSTPPASVNTEREHVARQ